MIPLVGTERKLLVFACHQLAGLPIDEVELRTSWAIDTLVGSAVAHSSEGCGTGLHTPWRGSVHFLTTGPLIADFI